MSAEPTGAMIQRRVNFNRLATYGARAVADELFWFDPEGELVWIDFLYAPGQGAAEVLPRLKAKFVGWQRRVTGACHLLAIEHGQIRSSASTDKAALATEEVG